MHHTAHPKDMTMQPIRFHEMRPSQIKPIREKFPVCYVPMGVLEWHGEHNPVGLDAIKATAMAEYFARHIGGLVMPTVWWGDNRAILAENHFGPEICAEIAKGHGLPMQAFFDDAERAKQDGEWKTWEAVMRTTFYELTTFGFKVIVTISGHYPLHGPAINAANAFEPTGRAKIISIIGFDLVKDRFEGDHAAKWETSLMLYLRPDLVDMSALDPDPAKKPVGVLGVDPRGNASAEYGKQGMEVMTEALRPKVLEALAAMQ